MDENDEQDAQLGQRGEGSDMCSAGTDEAQLKGRLVGHRISESNGVGCDEENETNRQGLQKARKSTSLTDPANDVHCTKSQ